MINNDLLQTQLSMGGYAGGMNPFNSPYASLQTAMNPAVFTPPVFNPFAGAAQTGAPNYGAIAQQQQQLQQLQQLASILASQGAIPQQNNPWQNPQVNPILAQQLALQAAAAYAQPQYGQFGSPFGQPFNSPLAQNPFAQTGYPLAPQSWVGQGQIHPLHLQHLAGRAIY